MITQPGKGLQPFVASGPYPNIRIGHIRFSLIDSSLIGSPLIVCLSYPFVPFFLLVSSPL